jgi:hypothetical protein
MKVEKALTMRLKMRVSLPKPLDGPHTELHHPNMDVYDLYLSIFGWSLPEIYALNE